MGRMGQIFIGQFQSNSTCRSSRDPMVLLNDLPNLSKMVLNDILQQTKETISELLPDTDDKGLKEAIDINEAKPLSFVII